MQTQTLRAKVDANGVLQLQLPPTTANQELDVVIVFQPALKQAAPAPELDSPESRGWNSGFFENVVGSWQGENIERPDQLPWETREELHFGEADQ